MPTKSTEFKLDSPVAVRAKGDCIWQKNKDTKPALVNRGVVGYEQKRQELLPAGRRIKYYEAGFRASSFVSLDVYGPEGLPFWYTDTGVPKEIVATFGGLLLEHYKAQEIEVCWSEHGMQGEKHWNFDVILYFRPEEKIEA